ncbi:MAG: bifunctional GlmU protein [Desulfobacterales bacterium GWB2_56_26]|nr:MAG: bifunctional GlmU protein [Desulfobacterales bacterium GWB2_56_26]
MLTVQSFFDLTDFPHREVFNPGTDVWKPLDDLKAYMDRHAYPAIDRSLIGDGIPLAGHVILHRGKAVPGTEAQIEYGDTTKGKLRVSVNGQPLTGASVLMAGAVLLGDRIDIGPGVLVETGAMIKSPAIIGEMTEVRQGSYLRGYCLAGKRCVLGHTTEIKHAIFLNDAKAGHFAYIGDSILGNEVNLGAGTKFANLRFLPGTVTFTHGDDRIDTGRRKIGAILGDRCQTGCNSVTSPGTLLAKGSFLMPNATARASYYGEGSLIR